MKRGLFLFVLLVVLLHGNAPAHFLPVALAADDPLCGTTIYSDLTLTSDIDCSNTTDTVIAIGADGITLDGQGHAIIAPLAGVVVSTSYYGDRSNVTVSNLNVSGTGSGTGVRVAGTSNTVHNVTATNRQYGIAVRGGSDIQLLDNDVSGAAVVGIWAYWEAVSNLTISGNNASGSGGVGIQLYVVDPSTNITISNNNVSFSAGAGIEMWSATSFTNVSISNNNASYSGEGIRVGAEGSQSVILTNSDISGNDVSHAAQWALYLPLVNGATGLVSNDVTGAQNGVMVGWSTTITGPWDLSSVPGTAIALYGDGNTVTGVDVSGTGSGTGVRVSGASNTVQNVTATNRETGILVDGYPFGGDNNQVLDNNVSSNAGVGILLVGGPYLESRIYHNNIAENVWNVSADSPIELSFNNEGNYWGHQCPGPLFLPGVDSNSADVVDSYPYGSPDGWLIGPPGCSGPVGGIADLPDLPEGDPSADNHTVLMGVAALALLALTAGAWHARRRWLR